MEFRVLGPVEAVSGETSRRLRGRPLALLGRLLIERGRVVSSDRLIDALWGDETPADPRNALQVVVSRLRRALGEELVVRRADGYAIDLAPGALDAERFEELLERARAEVASDEPGLAAVTLRAALSLWHGPAFADVHDAEFARPEVRRLEELRLEALEARIDADLALGAGPELVGELRGLVASHPLRERLHAALMLALVRAGRQADALDAYRDARYSFLDDLGLDLGPELHELQRAILLQQTSVTAAARPQARPALPLPSTQLVGRSAELAEAIPLVLGAGRLLTLCGPGGTGKTRLALHIAHELAPTFADGVVAVDLAPLREGSEVADAVARAIMGEDAGPHGDPLEAIGTWAAGRRLLVLLDNAEHVREATAGTVSALLAVEGPRVLVTSRERLGIAQEAIYEVPELTPADGVALFAAHAQRIDPSFTPDDATAVLCARLDWLPLAIELAAAQTRLYAPRELLARVREHLDLLDAGPQADPRRRTLRATTNWSLALLDADAARLFRQLAVFAGEVTWEVIEDAFSATPETLNALVDQHLVRRRTGSDRRPRFGMLETIRQYAAELLARDPVELATCRRRHAEATLAHVRRLDTSTGSMLDLEAMRVELRVAIASSREDSDPHLELGLVEATYPLWRLRGPYAEGIVALERALGRGTRTAPALLALADLTTLGGDFASGGAIAAEARARARDAGDTAVEVRALNLLGNAAFGAGDLASAADAYREAIALEHGQEVSGYGLAPRANLGHALLEMGDSKAARTTLEECLVACAEADDRRRASACLHSLGLLALHEGRVTDADEALRAGLAIARDLGVVKYQIDILGVLGAVRVRGGDVAEGVRLLACADVQAAALGLTPDPDGSVATRVREDALRTALESLGPGAFEVAFAAGRGLELEVATSRAQIAAADESDLSRKPPWCS